MAKASGAISTYKDLPIESTVRFVGWIDPKSGGSRWKRDERSKTWNFVAQLVAWQANQGPVVHDRMFIRKNRLDNSRVTSSIRQTPKGRMIQFKGRRPADTASLQKSLWYVNIVGPIEKPEKSLAIGKKAGFGGAPKSVVFRDAVFGSLKLDREHDQFETKASFRGTDMTVSFETASIDELKALIEHAKPLWRKRQAWFSAWRKTIYHYYMANLVDGWWEEDYALSEKTFYRLLKWPVGVQFCFDEGEFGYLLGGWCQELFTDHGIDATGSSISDMEVIF